MPSHTTPSQLKPAAQGNLAVMALTYCLGVFNDNYFKQAAMLLAVSAGLTHLQGWATMLFAAPFLLFSSLSGWCADRFPKKRVIVLAKGLEILALCLGAYGLITQKWWCIMAMIFVMGMQSTFFTPALNGSIPELYPAERVPHANARIKLATTLAILAGVALAGISLDSTLGQQFGLSGTNLVAAVALLCSSIGFITSLGIKNHGACGSKRAIPFLGPLNSFHDLKTTAKNRQLFSAIMANSFFYFSASLTVLLINTLSLEQLGFSQTRTSLLTMFLMAGVCCGSFLAARTTSANNWFRLLAPATVGMAMGFILTSKAVDISAPYTWSYLAAALFLSGIAGGLYLIPVASFLQVHPKASEKGRVLATANFCSFLAILGAGILFNLLYSRISADHCLQLLAIISVAVALCILFITQWKNLLSNLTVFVLNKILRLRYRIRYSGTDHLQLSPDKPVLFLPNHPALIDPVILLATLHKEFRPRPLAAKEQVEKPIIKQIAQLFKTIPIVRPTTAAASTGSQVYAALDEVIVSLQKGSNILLYPGGKLSRTGEEILGGNSAVQYILQHFPDLQIVIVKTSGLWGSSFSWASGKAPNPGRHIWKYIQATLANLVFFIPKRPVTIDLVAGTELMTKTNKQEINQHLEGIYSSLAPEHIQVAYFWWQGKKPQIVTASAHPEQCFDLHTIPASLQQQVLEKIEHLAGSKASPNQHLAQDLALDSLSVMELSGWLENEFGVSIPDPGALTTVAECVLTATGAGPSGKNTELTPPPTTWKEQQQSTLHLPEGENILDIFLTQARKNPDKMILADQISGCMTYRRLLTGIYALKPLIERLEGERIGLMLPASTSSVLAYFAIMISGKTPVQLNWTTGEKNLQHAIKISEVRTVVTAQSFLNRLDTQQNATFAKLPVQWMHLDGISTSLTWWQKFQAYLHAVWSPGKVSKGSSSETAAILFTSGSEHQPKAVPLSHANLIANMKDMHHLISFTTQDCLMGMLPPFHSLGLAGTVILPLCLGLRTVYHPNPTEPVMLSKLVEAYQVSTLITTPTFLQGILHSAAPEQLKSLRRIFTGAEKCSLQILQQLENSNPNACLCEGYGITECSPLVSLNTPDANTFGTVGRPLPSVEYAVVDDQKSHTVLPDQKGILLVRGPSIFQGYLGEDPYKGFCTFAGKTWYDTGDYVQVNQDGYLTFVGRKKRFVKIAGEMISLPAIEQVLSELIPHHTDDHALAVEAAADDGHPELVLFSTLPITREEANNTIKSAGLSGLHTIRKTIQLKKIPLLGTGKTDYQQLKRLAA